MRMKLEKLVNDVWRDNVFLGLKPQENVVEFVCLLKYANLGPSLIPKLPPGRIFSYFGPP